MNPGLPLTIVMTAGRYPSFRQVVLTLGVTLIALFAMPEGITSFASTVLVLLASLLLCVLTTSWHAASETSVPDDQFALRIFGLGAGLLAVFLSAFATILSGVFLVGIAMVLRKMVILQRPFVAAGLTLVLIPMWVWMAFDQWRWSLLALPMLLALAVIATSHLMDAYDWPPDQERTIPARAHRAAAWTSLALAGVLLVLFGFATGVSRPWLALAGITFAMAIPLEAGLVNTDGPLHRSLRIVSSTFLLAIVAWLIAIE